MITKPWYLKDSPTDLNSVSISDEIEIARKQCEQFSKRTNVDFNDLFTVALEKLPNIRNNFIPELNDNYPVFLKSSIKGYLKNYIRDNSFETKIPRKITEIYMKTRNYSSHLIASQHTKWEEAEIREAHELINRYRSYNVKPLKAWSVADRSSENTSEYKNSLQIIEESEADFELLNDYFVNKLSKTEMVTKYGYNYEGEVLQQTERVKQIANYNGIATGKIGQNDV